MLNLYPTFRTLRSPELCDLNLAPTPAGTLLRVRVIPRARKNEIAGVRNRALLVRLAARPVEGAANEALIAFLADLLGSPKRNVRLISGDRSRDKVVEIVGLVPDEVGRRLSTR
ncbi:MAG: DUF167 domain-containing protein [Acidobacteria bacterium]|nr:DUF167 domain-containing protein [Acidobacteriota bacterium]